VRIEGIERTEVAGASTTTTRDIEHLLKPDRNRVRSYLDWSGLAVVYCMAMAGIKPPYDPQNQAKSFLQAGAWLNFGTQVSEPQVGDVLIFGFGSSQGLSHVTLFETATLDGRGLVARGGNQSHEVNVQPFLRSSLRSIRRPPS